MGSPGRRGDPMGHQTGGAMCVPGRPVRLLGSGGRGEGDDFGGVRKRTSTTSATAIRAHRGARATDTRASTTRLPDGSAVPAPRSMAPPALPPVTSHSRCQSPVLSGLRAYAGVVSEGAGRAGALTCRQRTPHTASASASASADISSSARLSPSPVPQNGSGSFPRTRTTATTRAQPRRDPPRRGRAAPASSAPGRSPARPTPRRGPGPPVSGGHGPADAARSAG